MTTTEQTRSLPTLEKLTWDWQGHSIQYTVMGAGQPLVLVHGFGASIGHWRKNIPVLAQAGYQVFAIDLLGFGGSAKPALNYTVDLWVELLRDFWAANIGKPTVFAGNSIGGLLCLMVLAQHPEIAAGGVLLNPAGGLNHRPEELSPPLRFVMGTFSKLVGSKQFGRWMFDQVRQKHRIRNSLKQVYRDAEAITDELVDLLHEPSCDPGAQQVFASVLMAPPGPKPTELLPKIQVPLLVIWGEADPWTPIAGSQVYQSLVGTQSVEFVSIPNTGHCPHDERPEVVNSLMIQWLDRLNLHELDTEN